MSITSRISILGLKWSNVPGGLQLEGTQQSTASLPEKWPSADSEHSRECRAGSVSIFKLKAIPDDHLHNHRNCRTAWRNIERTETLQISPFQPACTSRMQPADQGLPLSYHPESPCMWTNGLSELLYCQVRLVKFQTLSAHQKWSMASYVMWNPSQYKF